jgi:hypothetical protein
VRRIETESNRLFLNGFYVSLMIRDDDKFFEKPTGKPTPQEKLGQMLANRSSFQ